MNEQCIQVNNLTKSFSGRKVINDLSFEVNKGEVFALLGHNGAGKSTTIDLILGLKSSDEGNATILGMDAAKHRKKVFEKVGVQLQHTEYQNMMPVVVFALITMISGNKEAGYCGLTFLQSAFVSLSTVGICCTAFMSIPITIVELRNQGILRRMYCSPCSPVRLLTCDILSSSMIAIVSTILLTIAAVIFGYRMSGNVFAFIGVWLLTMVSMFSIGLLVASLCRTTKSMNVATSLLYFPMLLFSGATIPAEVFPAGVRTVIKLMPLGIGIDTLKKVSVGCFDDILISVIILLVIAVICTSVAVKTFRWE